MFLLVLGVFMVVLRLRLSKQAVEWQHWLLGVRFSQRGYEISFVVTGVIFMIFGVLVLLQVVRFK